MNKGFREKQFPGSGELNCFSLFCSAFIIILAIFFMFGPSFAEPAKEQTGEAGLWAKLESNTANVGSTVVLELSYALPRGAKLAPGPEIKGLEGLTVVSFHEEPGRIRIKLLVDKLGAWKTGELSLSCLDKEENRLELTAEPVTLTVLSNLGERPEEARLKPIQGIIPLKPLWIKYLPWIAVPLVILLLIFGLFQWSKRIRGGKTYDIPQDPPHVRAKNEIDELEVSGLFEKGYIKEFYFRLSEVIRRYLEEIRGFPALELTTQEISLRVDNEQDRKLIPLLRRIDLVKFSDVKPTQAGKEEEIRMAVSYIDETGYNTDVQEGAAVR
ncbi:MAG TPA: hypothetical protein PK874_02590 [Desulfobacteraceae bacterium]|nr:hypothetical protein [Desulfobacteraceae bacterium]HPJ67481.1 hypothetical protein [Desulfobacteraceae bacterium]HPQ28014.1 hypothetical protein [Desulfobacteraceae bacterium]